MIAFLVIVFIIGVLYYLFPLIRICGNSMYPTFKDGEIILSTRIFNRYRVTKGEVVMYKTPNDPKRLVIKRVDHLWSVGNEPIAMFCLGDNSKESYDSRNYGYVSLRNIVCKPIKQRKKVMENE